MSAETPADGVGLCRVCRHARIVRNPRSAFWLCRRSATDPTFSRYPRLPVVACPGWERGEPEDPQGADTP